MAGYTNLYDLNMNNKKVIIIAEAGINHNGDVQKAFMLIDKAVEAKVDYVKFQTFKTELVIAKNAPKASYQIMNSDVASESQFEMAKKLEFSQNENQILIDYCIEKKIKYFSTAFDLDSLEYLHDIGLDLVKIPSGEITNLPYLRKASRLFKKVILSTGMANMKEIKGALNVFLEAGIKKSNITILHCNTEYPTPMEDVNLNAMLTIQEAFKVQIGYSDHTEGIEIPTAAVAMGAKVIEKHFTLDKNMPGPDHRASLEPDELKSMVKAIRNIEMAMGNGIKVPSQSEQKNIIIARKSIHINTHLKKGEVLKDEHIICLRPGDGLSPMIIDKVIGLKVKKDLKPFTKLSNSDLIK
jgi:N-acetylneuraminate synthase